MIRRVIGMENFSSSKKQCSNSFSGNVATAHNMIYTSHQRV
jgi:hypothetical protein